jgi:hypothetical protein
VACILVVRATLSSALAKAMKVLTAVPLIFLAAIFAVPICAELWQKM